jgi:hypothetical protein
VRVGAGRQTLDCGLLPLHHQPGDREGVQLSV